MSLFRNLDCILTEIHPVFLFYSTFISNSFSEITWTFFHDFLCRVTFHSFIRQCEFRRNYIQSCHFRPYVRRRSACTASFLLFALIASYKIILVFTLQLYSWLSSCPILPSSICYRIFLNISLTVRSVRLTVFYFRPPVIFRPFYTLFFFSHMHVYDIIFKYFIDFKLLSDFLSFFLSSAIIYLAESLNILEVYYYILLSSADPCLWFSTTFYQFNQYFFPLGIIVLQGP